MSGEVHFTINGLASQALQILERDNRLNNETGQIAAAIANRELPDEETRLKLFRLMQECREMEQRAYDLFMQNLIKGTSHLALGQEAVTISRPESFDIAGNNINFRYFVKVTQEVRDRQIHLIAEADARPRLDHAIVIAGKRHEISA